MSLLFNQILFAATDLVDVDLAPLLNPKDKTSSPAQNTTSAATGTTSPTSTSSNSQSSIQTSSQTTKSEDKGDSTPIIIGVSVLAALLILAVICFAVYRRKKSKIAFGDNQKLPSPSSIKDDPQWKNIPSYYNNVVDGKPKTNKKHDPDVKNPKLASTSYKKIGNEIQPLSAATNRSKSEYGDSVFNSVAYELNSVYMRSDSSDKPGYL